MFKHPKIQSTLFRTVSPIILFTHAWTLSFAHNKESAALTTTIFLWSFIQRQLTFISVCIGFQETNSLFVCSSTIATFTLSVNSTYRGSRIRITSMKCACNGRIVTHKDILHILE